MFKFNQDITKRSWYMDSDDDFTLSNTKEKPLEKPLTKEEVDAKRIAAKKEVELAKIAEARKKREEQERQYNIGLFSSIVGQGAALVGGRKKSEEVTMPTPQAFSWGEFFRKNGLLLGIGAAVVVGGVVVLRQPKGNPYKFNCR
jgi:hypothetical protein